MKLFLRWTVAVQLVLGGIGVAALSAESPLGIGGPRPSSPANLAVAPAAAGEQVAGVERAVAGKPRPDGRSAASSSTVRPATVGETAAPGSRGRIDDAAAAKGISFRPPVDFATGATPSSAAFNKLSGDQVGVQLSHVALSDSVATGDFDHDGHADVVQTNVLAGSLSVFLGDGRGGFAAPKNQAVGVQPNFVVTGDIDDDGDLDLLVADTGANGVFTLRGDGKGRFSTSAFLPVANPRTVAIGRIDDGDDLPDLAVASASPVCPRLAPECNDGAPAAGGVAVFIGLGGGAFRPGQTLAVAHASHPRPVGANAAVLQDFDGDGLDDLAVAVGTSTSAFDTKEGQAQPTGDDLLVFLNRDDPVQPFGLAPDEPAIRIGATPDAIAVGDWNGDARPDLATLENGSGSITSLLGNGRGHFRVAETNASVGGMPRGLSVGDFDDDGSLDLVTASFGTSTVSVLDGRGDGTFEAAVDHWVGGAPTGVAVGNFDGDRRLDLVAGRLRTDQLTLLINDGPKRGDGVVVHRNISYRDATGPAENDPYAFHHTLDVYLPPAGTAPYAGSGDAYPVVFYAHGGGGVANNKTFYGHLLRTLASQGIVAVSTNYRLGPRLEAEQVQDVVDAFGWTVRNIGSARFGGDPDNVVVFGHSAGSTLMNKLATDAQWLEEQRHIRGLVLAGGCQPPGAAEVIPESLLLSGDEGLEIGLRHTCESRARDSENRRTKSTYVNVPGRDHVTLMANLALADDLGRIALDAFLREHLDP